MSSGMDADLPWKEPGEVKGDRRSVSTRLLEQMSNLPQKTQ